MNQRFHRIAAICGLLAPTLTLTLIFISIKLSPWFSWQDSALSDMGVSATSNVFNATLFMGGALQLIFVLGGLRSTIGPGQMARWGLGAVLIGAIALPLIGVFTEAYGRTHYYIAATYFLATPLGYSLIGGALIRRGDRVTGWLSIAAGLTALLAITLVPHTGIAVPEILAATIMGAWTFSISVKLLVENSPHE